MSETTTRYEVQIVSTDASADVMRSDDVTGLRRDQIQEMVEYRKRNLDPEFRVRVVCVTTTELDY